MIQPARVIPSNASPLRVLQEQSGNRQHSDFAFGDEFEQKYSSSVITKSSYSNPHQEFQQSQAPLLYHPQPQHRQPWRYGHASQGNRHPQPELDTGLRFEAERLHSRFRKSDQYVKYRNRQMKDDKGNAEQKWPDQVEKAFFRALVEWPPMGRRKFFWKEKQRGRNELIADCIEDLTGVAMDRKQVSSHIQVLKPFVENDPYIMKWLAFDNGAHTGRYPGGRGYTSGRRLSNYPVTITLPQLGSSTRIDPHALRKAKANLDVFEPADFQMFVQRNCKVSKELEEDQRLHTYTQSINNPPETEHVLEDFLSLDREFPLLATMHAQRSLDCNVLEAEASLAFPTKTWKGEDGSGIPGIELGIYFLCTSRHLPPTPVIPTSRDRADRIVVNNSFYENGVYVKDHSGPSEARFEPSERGGIVETRIKFGSTFWARTLGRLALRLLDPNRDHREEVDSYLNSITAVQEVVAWTEYGPERLLVIHWKFRLSSSTRGKASWRKLVLPGSSQSIVPTMSDRVDSVYDHSNASESSLSQPRHIPSLPTLQSPFEYESSSGSTLSSASWPTDFSDGSALSQQGANADFPLDNTFDFTAGAMNFSYDPSLNFDNFDSSAFDFHTSAVNFAADPTLQDYSHQWYDGYTNGFEEQQHPIGAADSFTTQSELNDHVPAYHDYSVNFDQHVYVGAHDSQAYGGAGQEIIKEEDALAALADASFIASALSTKQEAM